MSWKRAVFFGGAMLVLAACSDATAPSSLTKLDGVGANSTSTKKTTTTTPTTTTPPAPTSGTSDECTGLVIHTGLTVITCTTGSISW